MSFEETNRIIRLIKNALKEDRSRKEAFHTFKEAGIITEKGNLKTPYKDIFIPVRK